MGELVKIYLECSEFHGNRQKGKFVQKAIAKRRLMRQSSNASSIPQLPVNEPLLQKFPPGHSSETLDSQEHQLIEVSSEESQVSPKKPVSAGTWIDSTAMVVCRFVDSKVEKATMSEGPNPESRKRVILHILVIYYFTVIYCKFVGTQMKLVNTFTFHLNMWF